MKRMYLFLAAAAMLLTTACSNDDAANGVALDSQTTAANLAVGFDTYTANATRAGQTGVMNTTQLQTTGFGVFAYQSEASWTSDNTPNFMYNQHVTYTTPSWIYSPLKYWPNETGSNNIDDNGARSGKLERLTFFAYAPYVVANPATGAVTSAAIEDDDNATPTPAHLDNVGITTLTKNTDEGAAKVTYQIAYTPSNSVDLLWGVAPAGGLDYQSVNPADNANAHITRLEGTPLIDLVKPDKDQKIKFLFKHALARLGMTVVAAVDQIAPGGSLDKEETKIFVNSVTITDASSPKTIATTGDLILKNNSAGVANWDASAGDLKLVINSSRELNSALIGTKTDFDDDDKPGVTTSETPVIAGGNYFMLIPTPGQAANLDVTIDYTVITKDTNVEGEYAITNNVITKQITLNSTEVGHTGFTNNKAYNLKLILGLTSVKLDAEVADWQLEGDTDVDLPRNQE